MFLWVVGAAACDGGATASTDTGRLQATVIRPQRDTSRFALSAAARSCAGGRSLLLQAADERGNGVLVLLRYGDSLTAGRFPLIAIGDSLTPRGANVATRYMKGDVAHGVALDSGAVDLTAARGTLGARVRGSGLEGAVRVAVEATYDDLRRPAPGDTIPCRFMP